MKIFTLFKTKEDEEKKRQRVLFDFLIGRAPNSDGVTLKAMHEFSFEKLETSNDYIQWMFPIMSENCFHSHIPNKIDPYILRDERVKRSIRKSFEVMLKFYGYEWLNNSIVRSKDFKERSGKWIRLGNHNYWRITRIIECLRLFSLNAEAEEFVRELTRIYNENQVEVGEKSFAFWIRANQFKIAG